LPVVQTQDGSVSFFSPVFGEAFHSQYGAWQEAVGKFVRPVRLVERAARSPAITLLDVCYGLGYNSAVALAMVWSAVPNCAVTLLALDCDRTPAVAALPPLSALVRDRIADPVAAERAIAAIAALPEQAVTLPSDRHATKSLALTWTEAPGLRSRFILADARRSLPWALHQGFHADTIFHDPFSPTHCPQLWTVEFWRMLAAALAAEGWIATYSCAAAVRAAAIAAGLSIGDSAPVGRRSPGTLARHRPDDLLPLTLAAQEQLRTRAAVPYRDPTGRDAIAPIVARRQQEQAAATHLESTSAWKRRWRSHPSS
jgi:tRNA U34 5-methylaminomethyl-2-thiouridine-forming methyltransferase MnmC